MVLKLLTFYLNLVTIIKSDCSNPFALLLNNVNITTNPYLLEEKYIECYNITKSVCCDEAYYKGLGDRYYNTKKEHIISENFITEKFNTFLTNYYLFMNVIHKITPEKVSFLTNSTVDYEIKYINYYYNYTQTVKKKCTNLLLKHYGTMLCLSCSPNFNDFTTVLRNKTVLLTLDENMCQEIISECKEYAEFTN